MDSLSGSIKNSVFRVNNATPLKKVPITHYRAR